MWHIRIAVCHATGLALFSTWTFQPKRHFRHDTKPTLVLNGIESLIVGSTYWYHRARRFRAKNHLKIITTTTIYGKKGPHIDGIRSISSLPKVILFKELSSSLNVRAKKFFMRGPYWPLWCWMNRRRPVRKCLMFDNVYSIKWAGMSATVGKQNFADVKHLDHESGVYWFGRNMLHNCIGLDALFVSIAVRVKGFWKGSSIIPLNQSSFAKVHRLVAGNVDLAMVCWQEQAAMALGKEQFWQWHGCGCYASSTLPAQFPISAPHNAGAGKDSNRYHNALE